MNPWLAVRIYCRLNFTWHVIEATNFCSNRKFVVHQSCAYQVVDMSTKAAGEETF